MTRTTVRKLQVTCFLSARIPLVAVAVFAFYAELSGQTALLLAAFPATLASAILPWTRIGRA